MAKTQRALVIPGETIVAGSEFLPGDGAYRDGEDVVAARYGLSSVEDNHVRVIAVSGAYYPRRSNTIIATVVGVTFNGWLLDFGGADNAFLPVSEVYKYINKNELREFLDFGDSAVVKVWEVKGRGVDVSMKMRGFGRIDGGMIISVNPNKVPRIIGKEGSMVKLIRSATGCDLTVGQNGKVWIRGDDTEKEAQTRQIVEFIAENSTIAGLTKKVEDYIKELGLSVEAEVAPTEEVEAIEENTDAEEAKEETKEEVEETKEDKE